MVLPGDAEWKEAAARRAVQGGKFQTVVAVFPDFETAEHAIGALHQAGYTSDEVSLVAKGTEASSELPSQAESEHAVHGAERGAIVGGILGGLVGIAALAIPGVAPIAAAGWLAAALGGAAAGAAAGGLIGAMTEMGVPEDVARRYGHQVSEGNFLVMVVAEEGEREQNAGRILTEAGSADVESYPYQVRTKKFPGDLTYEAEEQLNRPRDESDIHGA